jgi:hypothetical protein
MLWSVADRHYPFELARFQLDSIEPSAQGPQSLGRFFSARLHWLAKGGGGAKHQG